jgi:putative endonuclease
VRGTWTLYILRCRDESLYVGITNALAERLAAHNAGRGAKYTRSRGPAALVWSKTRQNPTAARRLEYALKRLPRKTKLELIAGDNSIWRRVRRGLDMPVRASNG